MIASMIGSLSLGSDFLVSETSRFPNQIAQVKEIAKCKTQHIWPLQITCSEENVFDKVTLPHYVQCWTVMLNLTNPMINTSHQQWRFKRQENLALVNSNVEMK